MSAELATAQQAGASAPAVSSERIPPSESLGAVLRAPSVPAVGAGLAAVLAAPDAVETASREDAIVLDAEKLEVYALALELHAFAAQGANPESGAQGSA